MKKLRFTLHIVSALFMSLFYNSAIAQIVIGGSNTSNVAVTVKVNQSCTISTTSGLNFSVYDPVNVNLTASLNATATVSVVCTKNSAGATLGISNGGNFVGTRNMAGATSKALLAYTISQPPSNTSGAVCAFPGTPWTNVAGVGMLSIPTATDTLARLYNICGSVPGGQVVPADTNNDVIIATINF